MEGTEIVPHVWEAVRRSRNWLRVLCWDDGAAEGSTDPQWASGASPLGAQRRSRGLSPALGVWGHLWMLASRTLALEPVLGSRPSFYQIIGCGVLGRLSPLCKSQCSPQKDVGLTEGFSVKCSANVFSSMFSEIDTHHAHSQQAHRWSKLSVNWWTMRHRTALETGILRLMTSPA